jgi:hemolysin activation/secretion protein
MRPSAFAPVLSLTTLAISSVFAQTVPDAGSLQNQQQGQERRLPERLPEAEPRPALPAVKEADGLKVPIKSIRFSGSTRLATEEELQAVVAPAIGKELDFAGIRQLASRVTELLKSKGWFLSSAYLPEQDLAGGELHIVVLEGILDASPETGKAYTITVDESASLRIDPRRLEAIAERYLPAGAPAREDMLERALLLMKDMPGISAQAQLEPGSQPGSTRVGINATEGPLLQGNAWLDNYGNKDTGRMQSYAAARLNDPLGIGDQVSLTGTHARGLDLVGLGYALPLGSQGLAAQAAVSHMHYKIVEGTGQAAGLKGSASTAGLKLSYPFIRSRIRNLNGSLAYTAKALKDDFQSGNLRDKRIHNWNIGLSCDMLDMAGGGGLSIANLGWTGGRVDLSRNAGDAAADSLAYRAQGGFNKLNYGVTRLQRLTGTFTLMANFSGQATGDNLDSAEKFILGGPAGVRAYSGSEAMGDSGWLSTLELRYDLPQRTAWGNLQFNAFVDTGRIKLHSNPGAIPAATATGRNTYSLSGWGIGASLAKADSHAIRLSWAGKLGDNPGRSVAGLDADGRKDRSRIWLQVAIMF